MLLSDWPLLPTDIRAAFESILDVSAGGKLCSKPTPEAIKALIRCVATNGWGNATAKTMAQKILDTYKDVAI